MTLQDEVDDFVNKAQSRIAILTNEILVKNNGGQCFDDEILLFKQLRAAIDLLGCSCCEDCDDDMLTDNDKYTIMSFLITQGDLDDIPFCPFVGLCGVDTIVDGKLDSKGVPQHNALLGLQGGDNSGNYYHLGLSDYTKVMNLPPVSTGIEYYQFTADGTLSVFVVPHTLNTQVISGQVINRGRNNVTEYPMFERISSSQVRITFTIAPVAGTIYMVILMGVHTTNIPTYIYDIDGTPELDPDGTPEEE